MVGSTCMNCELYKEQADTNKAIIKKMLKSLPNSTLKSYLVELRIIRVDYLTGNVSWVKLKKK